ncbi:DUF2637 domain-containing protein [Streptacidiphilus carbonis]|uniref:DUF2637 domain-containing protein n=1 Tax=Streptacidiphilus carbonis TaxID=105422 RepID=UPI000AE3522D|nr:DUF2637 domain-containing protein [Streptacidiphilus carbonis]
MKLLPKILLVVGLVAVTAMAFRVSWNALRDVARAIGADHTAAVLYPIVVDGLMALALVATLVLTGQARSFALRVLAAYVTASLVLNYDHGLVAAIQSGDRVRLADWAPANWALMLLATSLPVGSIYFGSDLVAKVLHHQPNQTESGSTVPDQSIPDLPAPAPAEAQESVYLPSADSTPAPLAPDSDTETDPGQATVPDPTAPAPEPVRRPRPATGTVPDAARTRTPTRTPAELLAEARRVTADWPDDRLSGEQIRKALHTSSAKGRSLRDQLQRERADHRPGLHVVGDPDTGTQNLPQGEAPAATAH